MKGGSLPTMTNLSDLCKRLKILTDPETLHEGEREFLHRFLEEEARKKEQKRIEYLMRMSGIKRIKVMSDFDWTFNPKIPRQGAGVYEYGLAEETLQPYSDR